ncbi:MAG: YfhO family protein, partial [bacterium]|nr:YfhO family protein [bacterium]
SLFLSLGKFNPLYPLLYHLFPGLKWFRVPAEILLLFSFSLAILAGTGFQKLMDQGREKKEAKKKIGYILLTGGFFVFIGLLFRISDFGFDFERWTHFRLVITRFLFFTTIIGILFVLSLFYPALAEGSRISILKDSNPQLKLGRSRFLPTTYYIGLVLVLLLDLGSAHLPYLQTMKLPDFARFVYTDPVVEIIKQDKTQYRVLPLGNEMISNKWILTHTQSVYGYQSFPLKHYDQFWKTNGFTNQDLWKRLNVKYFISPEQIADDRLALVYKGPRQIYQVKESYPRAWVSTDRTGFVPYSGATVEITLYTANRINLKVQSPEPGYLVLSEIYYPGWKANLDGKQVQVGIVGSLLRSLPIPAGDHPVDFIFSPFSFWLGLIITTITWLGLVVILLYSLRKKI